MRKSWKLSDKLAFWGIIIAVLTGLSGLLFGQDLFGRISASSSQPQFQYVFEGAFDQSKPEYEVAFPFAWEDKLVSKAKILILAENPGKKYPGVAYIKIKKTNGEIIDSGLQWVDFSRDSGSQLSLSLNFAQLFGYSDLTDYSGNFDVSDPQAGPPAGHFTVYVEYAGAVMPGSERVVTVLNTPWAHRTYFDYYEEPPGAEINAYVEVINYGADSDFSIATCAYRMVTPSYQVDPTQVAQLDKDGWWPSRSGNLQSICGNEAQEPLQLKRGERKTVKITLPSDATLEQGYYDYVVYVLKKLPVIDYEGSWLLNWHGRNGRQHSTYVVIGK